MCFSPEMSFSAAAILGAIGIMNLRQASSKSELFLAAIPFVFALQQLSEGLVWLYLQNVLEPSLGRTLAENFYLFCALILWPFWIPLSLRIAEKDKLKRLMLSLFLCVGIFLDFYYVLVLFSQQFSISIVGNSLHYSNPLHLFPELYFSITIFPWFISSYPKIWIYGLLAGAAYFITGYAYEHAFISVWCFFAALMSIVLYFLMRHNHLRISKKLVK